MIANINPWLFSTTVSAATIEIKEKAKAFFTTQNRCVTKEDYEARTMNMSSRFGNIAKVIVSRTELPSAADIQSEYQGIINTSLQSVSTTQQSLQTNISNFSSFSNSA